MDELIEISKDSLAELRNLYKKNWPLNNIGFYTIDNYIRWFEKESSIQNLKVLSLNGDWSDGTYLIVDRYQLFINSLEESNGRLARALQLLDWTNGYKISCFLSRHRPAVVDVIKSHKLKMEYDCKTFLYYLPKAKAKEYQINPPPGVFLKPLTAEHVIIADALWPNRHAGSLYFLNRLRVMNTNFGAFNKQGELMAWCFHQQPGTLGALHVQDKFKRQGLGSWVTKAMAKALADNLERDTFALVDHDNEASKGMFEKLGFRHIDEAYVSRSLPFSGGASDWVD